LLPLLVYSRICCMKHWMGKVLSCLNPSSSTLRSCDVGRWPIFNFKVALWEEFSDQVQYKVSSYKFGHQRFLLKSCELHVVYNVFGFVHHVKQF
jgi:hypothetical protein